MAIHLDHAIVPAKDKIASAEFFAEIFGLTVKPGPSYFAQVQINDKLTFDFADKHGETLIRDIHDGTLSPDFPLPDALHAAALNQLPPNPRRAASTTRGLSPP